MLVRVNLWMYGHVKRINCEAEFKRLYGLERSVTKLILRNTR